MILSWYIPANPSVLVSLFGKSDSSICSVSSVASPVTTGFDNAAIPATAEEFGKLVESDSCSPLKESTKPLPTGLFWPFFGK